MVHVAVAPTIRTATKNDLPRLSEIYRAASLSNAGDAPNLLAHPELLAFDGAGVAAERTRLAELADGTIAGFATDLPRGDMTELEDLFVAPDFRRRGIARALIADAIERARVEGRRRMEVTANEHAMAFYESVGFVRVGHHDTMFGSAPRMHLVVRTTTGSP